MSTHSDELSHDYSVALDSFLERGDEAALSLAYELGRRAMAEGFGVLDMAVVHRDAVAVLILSVTSEQQTQVASAVADFFQETLSPFEMSFRGYRGANAALQQLNETLRLQKEAVEIANRELESFSYSVSHDLRAPLRAIDGFSQALLEDYAAKLDETGLGYLRTVREAAQRMGELIDDLLGLARVAQTPVRRSDVDVSALARQIADRLRAASPERCGVFRIEGEVLASADAHLLSVLLENLLGNAWKFTSKRADAEVEFGREQREGVAVYFVRDNGAGFDMSQAGRLFGAFQRLHSSAEFEGTGIGLATVQRVVLRHEGRVWAEGKPGAGATFYFTLGGTAK